MLHIALFVLVCWFCCMLLTTSLVSPSKGSGSETTSLKSETFASFRPRLRKKSFSLCSCSFDNRENEVIINWIHAIWKICCICFVCLLFFVSVRRRHCVFGIWWSVVYIYYFPIFYVLLFPQFAVNIGVSLITNTDRPTFNRNCRLRINLGNNKDAEEL